MDGALEALQDHGKPLFVLKDGTSLFKCYGLDRFSEDIDLDAAGESVHPASFFDRVANWCESEGFSYRVKKDTETTKRVFVDYREDAHLKIELSLRRRTIPDELITVRNGITVYTLSEICRQKCAAYQTRDRIRDLYDVSWICSEHYEQLDASAKDAIRTALEYKDLDQFDYLVHTDLDPLIDVDLLETRFLASFEKWLSPKTCG